MGHSNWPGFTLRLKARPNVRFGSKADIETVRLAKNNLGDCAKPLRALSRIRTGPPFSASKCGNQCVNVGGAFEKNIEGSTGLVRTLNYLRRSHQTSSKFC